MQKQIYADLLKIQVLLNILQQNLTNITYTCNVHICVKQMYYIMAFILNSSVYINIIHLAIYSLVLLTIHLKFIKTVNKDVQGKNPKSSEKISNEENSCIFQTDQN